MTNSQRRQKEMELKSLAKKALLSGVLTIDTLETIKENLNNTLVSSNR